MKVSVTLHEVLIQDRVSGESYPVRTLRPAGEIASLLEETEKEIIREHLERAVSEAYTRQEKETGER